MADLTPSPVSPSPPLGEVGCVHIRVADADRAAAFFASLFQWETHQPPGPGGVAHHVTNVSGSGTPVARTKTGPRSVGRSERPW